jgi:very-short-patch-repair endonuclease
VGTVLRTARGRYALPEVAEHRRTAAARTATLSHLSAALHHGWKVKAPPTAAWVTLPRSSRLRPHHRAGIEPRWADLSEGDARDGVTTPLRTVVDCARVLPFVEALAVADSALRSRAVSLPALRRAARRARGTGSSDVRRVARWADARAANPFESVLRALAIEEGYRLVPQLVVAEPGLFAVVDLGSEELRLAVEADGFEVHGSRRSLRRDCRRHTGFAVHGWSSLRFAYEDVLHEQEWVPWVLRSWRDVREGRTPGPLPSREAA